MSRLSFFGTNSENEKEPVVLIHIEGERVSGALALRGQSDTDGLLSHGQPPKIIFSCEEVFPVRRPDHDMNVAIVDVLKKVLARIEKEGKKDGAVSNEAIREVHCTLASPWFLSQTKIVREVKEVPELFSQKALEEMVERESHAFCDAFSKSEYGERFHEALELVERNVVSLSLNGYETAEPRGQKYKEIETALYFSVVGAELLKATRESVARVFHRAHTTFHTFPLVAFSVVRDVQSVPQYFLLADIDGEVSDFTIVKKGVAMQTITVPLGAQHFIRSLQKGAGVSPEMSLSVLSLHGMDALSDETNAKVAPILKKATLEWQAAVSESIRLLSEECFVPGTVIVASEDRLQAFFANLISDHSLGHGPSDGTPFSVLRLDREFISKHYHVDAPEVHAVNLLLTSLFISKKG
ncbi:MAG: hypothetical protein WCO79_01925 [bacterium]